MITKILIESEGDVNGFFTIHYENGSVRKGWSCDQGGIEMDDGSVLDNDTHQLCFDLWFSMDIDENDIDHRWYAEFLA